MVNYNSANGFETELSGNMGPVDLTANVVTTNGGPASPCILVIDPNDPAKREYVLFDGAFTGTAFVTSAIGNRYLNGSAAGAGITHTAGAKVRYAFTKQDYENLHTLIAAKLSLAGGTMTGTLILNGAPGANLHAATKKYVDDADAILATGINNSVAVSGDTMTGELVLPAASPSADNVAARKKYVDDRDNANKGGVVADTARFGTAEDNGDATTNARSNHKHGNPPIYVLRMMQQQNPDTIPTGVWTNLMWDIAGGHGNNISLYDFATFKFEATVEGSIQFDISVSFVANATGARGIRIKKNGTVEDQVVIPACAGAVLTRVPLSATFTCEVGDEFETEVFQSSGADLNVPNSSSWVGVTHIPFTLDF